MVAVGEQVRGCRESLARHRQVGEAVSAGPLLGHRSVATAERYYNLARVSEAATAWHDVLKDIVGVD